MFYGCCFAGEVRPDQCPEVHDLPGGHLPVQGAGERHGKLRQGSQVSAQLCVLPAQLCLCIPGMDVISSLSLPLAKEVFLLLFQVFLPLCLSQSCKTERCAEFCCSREQAPRSVHPPSRSGGGASCPVLILQQEGFRPLSLAELLLYYLVALVYVCSLYQNLPALVAPCSSVW